MRNSKKTLDNVLVNENDVSELRDALQIPEVLRDFDLFYLDFGEAKVNYGARYLEKDFAEGIYAICYNAQCGLEMLVKKDPGNQARLRKIIQEETPEGKPLPILTQVTEVDFENPKERDRKGRKDIVLRLLLFYATSKGKFGDGRASNLLGHEYLFFKNAAALEKVGRKGGVITALDINVTDETDLPEDARKRCRLSLAAVGFRPCSEWERKNLKAAKFVLDGRTGEFRRLYPKDHVPKDAVVWRKGNYPGQHATMTYLNASMYLKLGDEYNTLLGVLDCLEGYCGAYFTPGAFDHPFAPLTVQKQNAPASDRGGEVRSIRSHGYPELGRICVCDDTGKNVLQNASVLKDLRDQIVLALRCAWGYREDRIRKDLQKKRVDHTALEMELEEVLAKEQLTDGMVTIGEDDDAGVVVSLVHERKYYERRNLPDRYNSPHRTPVVQHIDLETLEKALRDLSQKEERARKKGKTLKPQERLLPAVSRVLDECLFKKDVTCHEASLWNWKREGTWFFISGYYQGPQNVPGNGQKDAFFLLSCMEQREDNTCSFASMDELESGKKHLDIDTQSLLDVQGWFEKQQDCYGQHPECAVITPSGRCYYIVRQDNRFLLPDKAVYVEIMDRLPDASVEKVNLRRKCSLTLQDGSVVEDPLDRLFGAMTNINVWNGEDGRSVLYTAGVHSGNLQDSYPSFARACVMRAIVTDDGKKVEMDDPEIRTILDALWMPMIRATKDPSVLPYQAKYCREYLKLSGAYERAYR